MYEGSCYFGSIAIFNAPNFLEAPKSIQRGPGCQNPLGFNLQKVTNMMAYIDPGCCDKGHSVGYFRQPSEVWFLEPEASTIGCLEPLAIPVDLQKGS